MLRPPTRLVLPRAMCVHSRIASAPSQISLSSNVGEGIWIRLVSRATTSSSGSGIWNIGPNSVPTEGRGDTLGINLVQLNTEAIDLAASRGIDLPTRA